LIFEKFCGDLLVIGNSPNGRNINVGCGSEDVSQLCEVVRESGAEVGFALDGDGDRLVVIDETGMPLSGDQIIGIFAKYLFDAGRLGDSPIVVTEQSNCGLDSSLAKFGIDVVRCAVGDRNVYYAMLERGAMFGGEESGHLILREFSNTGDGILAGLFAVKILTEYGLSLSLLKSQISLFPKKIQNIRVDRKIPLAEMKGFGELLDSIKRSEPDYGRVFVRYSGTENKLRVLVEAKSVPAVDKILTCVCKFLKCNLA
jgi:phosphoglucosamine mutase